MKKVFFIDDQSNSSEFESRFDIIKEQGIEILYVDNIDDVIPIFQEYVHEIGLIILDIIIPPLDKYSEDQSNGGTTTGLLLLKEIRKINKEIPIIIFSIRRKSGIEMNFENNNVVRYLQKPIETAELVNYIKMYLK
jgi:DNA-binding response OmpR family regulator